MMKNVRNSLAISTASAAMLMAGTVSAETLPISGIYAAGDDAPSQFQSIVVERFDGNEGTKFAVELRNALSRAVIDGEDYFDVRRGVGPAQDADSVAWLNGAAFSEVEWLPSGTTEEKKCVAKDDDGDCIRHRVFTFACSELVVRFTGDVQLLDGRDELVYDRGFSTSASRRYCANQRSVPSVSDVVTGLVRNFARQVRYDFAPVQRYQDIRVLESRSGMGRSLRKPFKRALKLTKSDWQAACTEFERLNGFQPDHVTLSFNAGLCREAAGDLDGARALYQHALALEPGKDYPRSGMSRIASRYRAEEQLALHATQGEHLRAAREEDTDAVAELASKGTD